jgi:hypothetical protein
MRAPLNQNNIWARLIGIAVHDRHLSAYGRVLPFDLIGPLVLERRWIQLGAGGPEHQNNHRKGNKSRPETSQLMGRTHYLPP